jgi:TonB family protein
VISILMLMLAAQDPAPAALPEPATPVAEAMVDAPAALPVLTVRPVETSSEAGQAAGHFGSVIVELDMQPDGTKGEVTVAETSRSELLDAEAVSLISDARLRPPATATRYRIEVEFQPYNVLQMNCRDFSRHALWFQQTWPDKNVKDTSLYSMSTGAMTALAMNRPGGAMEMLRPTREMEATWPRLITECERQPDQRYLRVLAVMMRLV